MVHYYRIKLQNYNNGDISGKLDAGIASAVEGQFHTKLP